MIVLTGHNRLGDTDRPTGFSSEEFVALVHPPKDPGAALTLASPKGGAQPLDRTSADPGFQTDTTRCFHADPAAKADLAPILRSADTDSTGFDAGLCAGGHGPLRDLVDDPGPLRLIEGSVEQGRPVAAVRRAPAVRLSAKGDGGSSPRPRRADHRLQQHR